MAIDMGWDGAIQAGSACSKSSEVTQITEWTLEMTVDALEKTNFGSTYDREFQPGLRSWTASLSGYSEDSDNVQSFVTDNFTDTGGPKPTSEVYLVMLTDNNVAAKCGFEGRAVLTGLTRGATPDGYQTFSVNAQGTGLLATYSTGSTSRS